MMILFLLILGILGILIIGIVSILWIQDTILERTQDIKFGRYKIYEQKIGLERKYCAKIFCGRFLGIFPIWAWKRETKITRNGLEWGEKKTWNDIDSLKDRLEWEKRVNKKEEISKLIKIEEVKE